MRKTNLLIVFILFLGHSLFAQTWDVLDKSMAAYNQNGGASSNQAWAVAQGGSAGSAITQKTGYVNFTKTNTGQSSRWAWVRPFQALADLAPGTTYSIEVKARVNPIGIADEASYFEANQISLRLGSKSTAAPIYLKYGDGVTGGTLSTTSGGTQNVHKINTAEWQVYRWVFHPDHSKYDVYIDGKEDPIFENVVVAATADQNGIYFGAESYHRCNIDVEYVKMGTGAFFSKPKIASVALSVGGQGSDKTETIVATVSTILVEDNQKVLVSLVDEKDKTIVEEVEGVVSQNKATINFTIPSGITRGQYYVKATVPDGKIGNVNIAAQKESYLITSSAYEGKNLATFGNSITFAANSWAYQVHNNLRFGNLYNGAISAAVWYKRTRTVAGQTIQTQNYYDDNFAGIITYNPTTENVQEHQKRINNTAIVHLQKYFIDLDNKIAPIPDVIIFSYGTNDEVSNMGSAETALQGDNLSDVDIFKMAGALRWSLDTLKIKFPNVKIFVALPLQATRSGQNEGNLKKMEILKAICDARSVPYFDCFNESGITTANAATYLGDGLHPNEPGKVVHGAYITKRLEDEADKLSSIWEAENNTNKENLITISAQVLYAGQNISVMSAVEENPLSEVTVYSIAGNEVYRKSISEQESIIEAPGTSGIYLFSVSLKDKTTRVFKVLVK